MLNIKNERGKEEDDDDENERRLKGDLDHDN